VAPSTPVSRRPIEVFFSYAHRDEALRNDLADHLRLLERKGIITGWHDRLTAEKRQGEDKPLPGRFLCVPQGRIVRGGGAPEKNGAPDGVCGGREAPYR
jgi:hypothetical protein